MWAGDYNWLSSLASLSKLQNILLLDEKVKPNATLKFQRDFADRSTTDIANLCYFGMKNVQVVAEPCSGTCINFSVTCKSKCES